MLSFEKLQQSVLFIALFDSEVPHLSLSGCVKLGDIHSRVDVLSRFSTGSMGSGRVMLPGLHSDYWL